MAARWRFYTFNLFTQFKTSYSVIDKFWSGANVINKFQSSLCMLCWNRAFWLYFSRHMTCFNQLDCFIMPKIVHDIGSWSFGLTAYTRLCCCITSVRFYVNALGISLFLGAFLNFISSIKQVFSSFLSLKISFTSNNIPEVGRSTFTRETPSLSL